VFPPAAAAELSEPTNLKYHLSAEDDALKPAVIRTPKLGVMLKMMMLRMMMMMIIII